MIKDLIDAFIALDQLDDEDVKGMLHEGKSYSVFSSDDELEDAKEYLNRKEDNIQLQVIDPNADAINHLKSKEDYIGQAIITCKKCLAPTFLDMQDLEPLPEDPTTYNIDMECPNCHTKGNGFELIGQAGKVEEPEDKEEVEIDSTEDSDGDEEVEITDDEESESTEGSEEDTESEEVTLDNDQKGSDDVSFENDLEEPDDNASDSSEENSDESGSDAEEGSSDDVEEFDFDSSDEEDDDMDTETSEEEVDDVEEPKAGDEYEESLEEDEEDKEPEPDKMNELASEAWLMNKVIESMNNEEAYYGGWLYTWPDGETEKDCQQHFGEQEDFDDLRKAFIDTYKAYHADGLFEPDRETIEYARKQDSILNLRPIDIFMAKKKSDSDQKEQLDESLDNMSISDLLNCIIEPENIKQIIIYDISGDEPRTIYTGKCDALPCDMNSSMVESFNVADGHLICNVDDEEDCERCKEVNKMLRRFDDKDTEKISICDAGSGDEIFSGCVDDAINDYGKSNFVSFDTPMILKIYICDPDSVTCDDETASEDADDQLISNILKANNLSPYKLDNPNTDEYWISECIKTNDDLELIYERFVKDNGKKLSEQFKSVTGFKDELDTVMEKYGIDASVTTKTTINKTLREDMNTKGRINSNKSKSNISSDTFKDSKKPSGGIVESFIDRKSLSKAIEECKNNNRPYSIKRSLREGFRYDLIHEDVDDYSLDDEDLDDEELDLEIIDEPEVEIIDDPEIEIIDEPEVSTNSHASSTALVDPQMSEIEIQVLDRIHDIALTISDAIRDTYGIEADPALIVADMIQDLRLISGVIRPEDLQSNYINDLTKEMFNSYNDFYEAVDEILTEVTGESIHTTAPEKLTQAINSLNGPSFTTEAIYAGIQSPQFLQLARKGLVPYLTRSDVRQIANARTRLLGRRNESMDDNSEVTVEFDTDEFDKEINKYFNEAYEDTLIYTTTTGSVTNEGLVTLNGIITGPDMQKDITFKLTPTKNITESLKVVEDRSNILTESSYIVTNNISDEKFTFALYK